jgi:3-hydroxyacyl-CoA dehydrogenase/3a,7a,12a-trihydroxy-5b-cholest-24-enoyl-CoA hydratase
MWKDGEGKIVFRCKVVERDATVISNAAVELYKEVPKAAAKPVVATTVPAGALPAPATAAPAADGAVTSDAIMFAIGHHIETHPELVGQIGNVFQWKLTGPDSTWVLDVKNGKGSCAKGTDVTLELSDADFIAMATGKADAQKLYFGGKLKISGNVMASQKLEFLKKIDRDAAAKAYAAKHGGGAPKPAAAASGPVAKPTMPNVSMTDAVMFGIGYHLEQNPDLASKIQTVFQWKLSNPDSQWVLDVKNGKGSCAKGTTDKADVTLELSDSDFVAMATGQADPQKLYFGGKLKISGNIMASQKLEFLKKIDRDATTKAYLAKYGAPAQAAAPAPAATSTPPSSAISGGAPTKPSRTPGIVAALKAKGGGDVAGTIQFQVKNPDVAFFVDAKSASEGTAKNATTTIRIEEDDLVALVKGQAKPLDLYMHGKLRVDGNVDNAHKLGFLQNLL